MAQHFLSAARTSGTLQSHNSVDLRRTWMYLLASSARSFASENPRAIDFAYCCQFYTINSSELQSALVPVSSLALSWPTLGEDLPLPLVCETKHTLRFEATRLCDALVQA